MRSPSGAKACAELFFRHRPQQLYAEPRAESSAEQRPEREAHRRAQSPPPRQAQGGERGEGVGSLFVAIAPAAVLPVEEPERPEHDRDQDRPRRGAEHCAQPSAGNPAVEPSADGAACEVAVHAEPAVGHCWGGVGLILLLTIARRRRITVPLGYDGLDLFVDGFAHGWISMDVV